jgi:hypothetical protein
MATFVDKSNGRSPLSAVEKGLQDGSSGMSHVRGNRNRKKRKDSQGYSIHHSPLSMSQK